MRRGNLSPFNINAHVREWRHSFPNMCNIKAGWHVPIGAQQNSSMMYGLSIEVVTSKTDIFSSLWEILGYITNVLWSITERTGTWVLTRFHLMYWGLWMNIPYPLNLHKVPGKEKTFPALQNIVKLRRKYANTEKECFQEGDPVTRDHSATTLNPITQDWGSQA